MDWNFLLVFDFFTYFSIKMLKLAVSPQFQPFLFKHHRFSLLKTGRLFVCLQPIGICLRQIIACLHQMTFYLQQTGFYLHQMTFCLQNNVKSFLHKAKSSFFTLLIDKFDSSKRQCFPSQTTPANVKRYTVIQVCKTCEAAYYSIAYQSMKNIPVTQIG